MCLAKWLQSTVNLHNGTTKSCCHSVSHKIDRDLSDPSVLHNTLQKRSERKNLLEGIRSFDCNYCWDFEKTQQTSPRFRKSSYKWATDRWDDVINSSWDKDIMPSYLEISFSNVCNFACTYCGPDLSSTWAKDLQSGDYSNHHKIANFTKSLPNKNNPYVDAFWKWWPELRNELYVLRITGGEPLLSKDLFKLMDDLIENPTNIKIYINTNLQPPQEIWDEFLIKAKKLKQCVKEFVIYTSLEATGDAAEYIRHGLNYDLFLKRLDQIQEFNHEIMAAVNILSYSSFDEFVNLPSKKFFTAVKNPTFLDVRLLPQQLKHTFSIVNFIDYANQELNENYKIQEWRKLYTFLQEFDRRRNLNSRKTFPELYETIFQYI